MMHDIHFINQTVTMQHNLKAIIFVTFFKFLTYHFGNVFQNHS